MLSFRFPDRRTVVWVGVFAVITILVLLGWWYARINSRQQAVEDAASARGFGSSIPSLDSSGGSMRENLLGLFSGVLGGVPKMASSTEVAARPRMFRTSAVPSAGALVLVPAGSTEAEVFFADRPTGNIFALPLSGGEARRVTNTLVPHVYEAVWVDESSLVLRHSNDGGVSLLTFLGRIENATTSDTRALTGTYLDEDIVAIVARPGGKEPALFYIIKTEDGAVGVLSRSDGSGAKRIWSSPLSGWNVSWTNEDRVVLSQKAAEGVAGSAYILTPSDGSLSLVVGDEPGLVALPHGTEDAVIYSVSQNQKTRVFARINSVVRELPLSTFAEKCVWAHGLPLKAYCAVPDGMSEGALPDAWYRGEVSLSDRWFIVDPEEASAELLIDPSDDSGLRLDVLKPSLSASGRQLLFTDKRTGTGWVLSI